MAVDAQDFLVRKRLALKMQGFRKELAIKNGDAYFKGVPDALLRVVEVDHYVSINVINGGVNAGCTKVEIGYGLDPIHGYAEWGIHYNETEALRYALGAWLA